MSEDGECFKVMLERSMNEDDVELMSGIELTISLRDIVIFED